MTNKAICNHSMHNGGDLLKSNRINCYISRRLTFEDASYSMPNIASTLALLLLQVEHAPSGHSEPISN